MTERHIDTREDGTERLERFRALQDRLEAMTARAELLGLNIRASIEAGESGYKMFKQQDEPMFGASLGKLPLAVMAIERLEPYEELWNKDMHGVPSDITTAPLVDRMLRISDNVSYRILAEVLGGPDAINDFYLSKGWQMTRVKAAQNGRTQLAETTPADALGQLNAILGHFASSELADIARNALSEQEVNRYGIRQLKIDDPNIHIFNKTGEYPGDLEDPFVFRHDVGSIFGPKGRVSYALMTAIPHTNHLPDFAKKFLADTTVKHFGAELIDFVGGKKAKKIGSLAIKSR